MARKPSNAQVTALAWGIYRGGADGLVRSMDFGWLEVRDATVAGLEAAGWADRAKYYDDARKWRWWWFYVTPAGRALPAVVAEVARMKAKDDEAVRRQIAEDDALVAKGDT